MDKKITEQEFFNLDNGIVQDITREFIYPHIYRNQSHLVSHLQEQQIDGFLPEDINNLYMTDNEIVKYFHYNYSYEEITEQELIDEIRHNGEDINEIYEWYLVSGWFLDRLKEINEPYLENDYGEYWGRTCTGQSIYLDYNIQKLAYKYSHDKRLFKSKKVA